MTYVVEASYHEQDNSPSAEGGILPSPSRKYTARHAVSKIDFGQEIAIRRKPRIFDARGTCLDLLELIGTKKPPYKLHT